MNTNIIIISLLLIIFFLHSTEKKKDISNEDKFSSNVVNTKLNYSYL